MVGPLLAKRTKSYPQLTRERIKAGMALDNLRWVEGEIRDRLQTLDLAEVPALRLYSDIQRWKIDKVLPELKAVEHSGTVTQDVVVRFNP
jgi:hypothetical protein